MKKRRTARILSVLLAVIMVAMILPIGVINSNAAVGDRGEPLNELQYLLSTYNAFSQKAFNGDGLQGVKIFDSGKVSDLLKNCQYYPGGSVTSVVHKGKSIADLAISVGASLSYSRDTSLGIDKLFKINSSKKFSLSGEFSYKKATESYFFDFLATNTEGRYIYDNSKKDALLDCLNEDFLKALNGVSGTQYDDPEAFFDYYGTHILTGYTMGGIAESYTSTTSTDVNVGGSLEGAYKNDISAGDDDSSVKVGLASALEISAKVKGQYDTGNYRTSTTTSSIGGNKIINSDTEPSKVSDAYTDWANSFVLTGKGWNCDIITDDNLRFWAIWDLLPDCDRKTELYNAYLNKSFEQDMAFFSEYVYNPADSVIKDYNGYKIISTAEQFKNIGNDLSGKYVLACNIELGGSEWTPIGTAAQPFTGILDGNGNTVSGLRITKCTNGVAGLFGYNNGTVMNLDVVGSVDVGTAAGTDDIAYIGGIAGKNNGTIEDCRNRVTVNGAMSMSAAMPETGGTDSATALVIDESKKALAEQNVITLDGSPRTITICASNPNSANNRYYFGVKLKGEAGVVYNNVNIVFENVSTPSFIILENADIVGGSANGTIFSQYAIPDVTIVSSGASNAITGTTNAAAVNMPGVNLNIIGSAALTVRGGDGSDGADGEYASLATYYYSEDGANGSDGASGIRSKCVNIDILGIIEVYGGSGGHGGNGGKALRWSSYKGGNGGNGGSGGSTIDISSNERVNVYSGEVYLFYGSGGDGGIGGVGGSGNFGELGNDAKLNQILGVTVSWEQGTPGGTGVNGGIGGDGGNGGICCYAVPVMSVFNNGKIMTLKGTIGNGGDGGKGGVGGNGGIGGSCVESTLTHKAVGAAGGAGGKGGQGGKGGNGTVAGKGGMGGDGGPGGLGGTCPGGAHNLGRGATGESGSYGNDGNTLVDNTCKATLYTSTKEYSVINKQCNWDTAKEFANIPAGIERSDTSTFTTGVKKFAAYDNTSKDVKVEVVDSSSDNPLNNTDYELKITSKIGADGRHHGGYYQAVTAKSGAVFYYAVLAKIPVGYQIGMYNNSIGDDGIGNNAPGLWLTGNDGTGNWKWYVGKTICGTTGNFDNLGFVAILGGDGKTDNIEWSVAYSTIIEGHNEDTIPKLVSIGSANETALISELASLTGKTNYGIGIHRDPNDINTWIWEDGRRIYIPDEPTCIASNGKYVYGNCYDSGTGEIVYSNWGSGEPNGASAGENYGHLTTDYKWNDTDFSHIFNGYITERNLIAATTNTFDRNTLVVGGICGSNGGTVSNCYNDSAVCAAASSQSTGVSAVAGGIAGINNNLIENSRHSDKAVTASAKTKSSQYFADAFVSNVSFGGKTVNSSGSATPSASAYSSNDLITESITTGDCTPNCTATPNAYWEGRVISINGVLKSDYLCGDIFNKNTLTLSVTGQSSSQPIYRYNFLTAGITSIVVKYGDCTRYVPVNVLPAMPESIAVYKAPKTAYIVNDTFTTEGMVLNVTYNNRIVYKVLPTDANVRIQSPSMALTGTQSVIVRYIFNNGLDTITCSYDITISSLAMTGIQIVQTPNKLTYYIGEMLDKTGLQLQKVLNNNTVETIGNDDANLKFEYDFSTSGKKTVTVKYNEFSATFDCTVVELTTLSKLIVENKTVTKGSDIKIALTLANMPEFRSFALSELTYDTDVFELTEFSWKVDGTLKSWNGTQAAFTKEANADMNGVIIELTFKLKDNCTDYLGEHGVSCAFTAKNAAGDTISVAVIPGKITMIDVLRGDLNGDKKVNEDDAIWLLYHIFFPDDFAINQDCDFNKDGKVNEDDALYILYYTFFPVDFPL